MLPRRHLRTIWEGSLMFWRPTHPTPAVGPTPDHACAHQPLILVVDDDADICAVITLALEDAGYRVATATNGLEALKRMRASRPALVLLDIHMPRLDGRETLDWVQTAKLSIPVVFMTAGEQAPLEAKRHHAAGYLAKPFRLDDLLAVVERLVAV